MHPRIAVALALVFAFGTTAAGSAAAPAWTTYRHDAARTGIDPDSTSPISPTQAWQTSSALDGSIYGEPLVYGSRVYVATENDTVYALDASSGAIIWQKHLATAVPSSKLPCGDISPVVGITSTPVIDPSTGAIYVVADTWDGSTSSSIKHQLFGLSVTDGSPAAGLPVTVDPPGSTPTALLQRAGLALDGNKVIIGFGGNYGDCGSYHGWLVGVPEAGGSTPQTFEVDPSTDRGAIWGAGNAPVIDGNGDVWTSTGNGSSSSFGYQESVIKLDANLGLLDYWAPSNWSSLDSSDTDLGSSMPLLLPGGRAFEIGKAGVGYLLSGSNLGHTGGTPVYQASVCSGSWGGSIYLSGVIYVSCSNGLHALSLSSAGNSFAPVSGWTVNVNAIGPPIYAGGLVWATGWRNGTLYGLDPSSGATRFSAGLTSFEHFALPSAAGGSLFVANGDLVTAFHIAAPPPAPPASTTTSLASSVNPSPTGRAVTFTATVAPAPDAGSVAFTDAGVAIPGCATVALSRPSGTATCTTTFTGAGTRTIVATYSGDPAYATSSSAPLAQAVTAPVSKPPPAPRPGISVTHLHVSLVRGRVRLSLTLSSRATLKVTLSARTFTFRCHKGRNSFTLATRPRAGRHRLLVTAIPAAGGAPRRLTITFVVAGPRRR